MKKVVSQKVKISELLCEYIDAEEDQKVTKSKELLQLCTDKEKEELEALFATVDLLVMAGPYYTPETTH